MRIFVLHTLLLCSLLLSSFKEAGLPHHDLRFNHFSQLKGIPEPSDIAYDKWSGHYYIVSDHGALFECDLSGKVIRKAEQEGYDFEGVEVTDSFVYVSDETPRQVYKYRKSDLSVVRTSNVICNGPMNKAYESIIYNEAKKCFVLVSEQPVAIVEYDEQFHETGRFAFHKARDISGARYHNGEVYLLSDLDETIFRCDPITYKAVASYKINVLNPEGLAFNDKDEVTITSDALGRIYFFNVLPDKTLK